MRFLSLSPFLALPALLVAAHQPNDVPPDPSYYDAPTAINRGHEAPLDAQKVQQDPWDNGPLVQRWRQWVRRQDTDSSETTEKKSESRKTEETTQDEPTTTEEKTTTTEDKPTTTDEPTSTTEESTTQESTTQESTTQESTTQESSSTVESTSTESSTSSTSSTSTSSSSITATEPGASCYSTTVSTSVVCSITTDGRTESASCITNRMTSSTCSPGLFCTIHPDSGATVCMEQHNEIGTEGIVVATFFGACIAGCMAVLVGMCLRDKRREKKWQSIQRVRTLKQAKRAERTNLMAPVTP